MTDDTPRFAQRQSLITDAMVEAGARVMATRRGIKNCDELITTTNAGKVPAWQFYLQEPRAILEAALSGNAGAVEADKLRLFLSILASANGEACGSDSKYNWINYFCDDAEPMDTFNQASKRGLTRVTHDSDSDYSVVYLTDAGRAFIAAPLPATQGDGE